MGKDDAKVNPTSWLEETYLGGNNVSREKDEVVDLEEFLDAFSVGGADVAFRFNVFSRQDPESLTKRMEWY
jgi:hypothetical protein